MHPMLISCFVAPDDEQAAQVIDWPSGPVEPAGDAEGQDAFPVVDTKIEPVVTLTKLAEILSGSWPPTSASRRCWRRRTSTRSSS